MQCRDNTGGWRVDEETHRCGNIFVHDDIGARRGPARRGPLALHRPGHLGGGTLRCAHVLGRASGQHSTVAAKPAAGQPLLSKPVTENKN